MLYGTFLTDFMFMMTSSNGNIFRVTGHLFREFTGDRWIPCTNGQYKGQWCGALMFSLIYAWMNVWVNKREAGDLRRHRACYDFTVMLTNLDCPPVQIIWTKALIAVYWARSCTFPQLVQCLPPSHHYWISTLCRYLCWAIKYGWPFVSKLDTLSAT